MMNTDSFTERQIRIINLITNQTGYTTCDMLCKELGFSRRTIQNDIAAINRQVPLIDSSSFGYQINRDNLAKINVANYSDEIKESHYILRRLIISNKEFNINELADKLYVSTSTLEKHIRLITPILKSFNLKLERSRGNISISGDEYSKRKLIASLIQEETSSSFNSLDSISQYFSQINISRIKAIVDESIRSSGYFLEESYSFNLYLNIVIALFRMRSNIYIEELPANYIDADSDEYRIAARICRNYASHWNLTPTEEDIIYIAVLLSGQIKPNSSTKIEQNIMTPAFVSTIDDILKETFNYFMIEMDYQDSLYNFCLHADAMIKRLRNDQAISNDILDNLKKNCPFIFEVAIFICKRISERFDIAIPDSEIGFIAVHIGFLINSADEDFKKIKILLLCSDYHNLAETIRKEILKYHGEYVELTIGNINDEVLDIDFNVDLIISIKPLNIIGKKVLVISPLYTKADRLQIYHVINEELIAKESLYKNRTLSSFFHESLFFKSDDFSTKEEAISFLCDKAIHFGLAEEGYTEEVLERESLSSTCFFESFAIPHSMSFSSKRTMFTVLISEKGIRWDGHLIHIVLLITVAKVDKKEFKNVYDEIIRSLWDKNKIPSLVRSNTLLEFISQL